MQDQSKRLTILTAKEIDAIYGLPRFTDEERDAYFSLDSREQSAFEGLRTLTAKIYFILQLGYFKASRQFFVFDLHTIAEDAAFVLRRYFPDVASLSEITISKPTRLAQQDEILRLMDYQVCSKAWKRKLEDKANALVIVYTKPLYVFKELVTFLEYQRVVLPGYTFLQEMIGKAMTGERLTLEKRVHHQPFSSCKFENR